MAGKAGDFVARRSTAATESPTTVPHAIPLRDGGVADIPEKVALPQLKAMDAATKVV